MVGASGENSSANNNLLDVLWYTFQWWMLGGWGECVRIKGQGQRVGGSTIEEREHGTMAGEAWKDSRTSKEVRPK